MFWHYIIIGLICLLAGCWIGGRHGRRVKRDAVHELNTNSLDLLKTKSKFSGIESERAEFQRKEKLLKMTLQQLKGTAAQAEHSHVQVARFNALRIQSEAQVKKLQQDLILLNRRQNLNQTLLKQKAQKSHKLAVHSHLRAVKATSLARKATAQLKRLENAFTAKQAVVGNDQKSYGVSDQVRLSVVDQPRLAAGEEIFKRVSNSESARLGKLSSSKKAIGPLN